MNKPALRLKFYRSFTECEWVIARQLGLLFGSTVIFISTLNYLFFADRNVEQARLNQVGALLTDTQYFLREYYGFKGKFPSNQVFNHHLEDTEQYYYNGELTTVSNYLQGAFDLHAPIPHKGFTLTLRYTPYKNIKGSTLQWQCEITAPNKHHKDANYISSITKHLCPRPFLRHSSND